MSLESAGPVLVVNSGSSSLKFGVFAEGGRVVVSGGAQGIGRESGRLEILSADGKPLFTEEQRYDAQADALRHISEKLSVWLSDRPAAIGHRIVHGGSKLVTHQRITPEVIETLKADVHFAPLHIPPALALIEEAEKIYAGVAQFACFDTAFHQTMPEAAWRLPLPAALSDEGVRRYGFHGLSYESVVQGLGSAAPARMVVAHLGNGASLAAIKDGKSIDTSMGMTPTGGIPMGTRTGDLDPGVVLFLMRTKKLDADQLEELLNRESGLVALSELSSDMRELQAAAAKGDGNALLAIDIFCRSIAKTAASYAVVLGGLDLLVFTGGIGQHSAETRAAVCEMLRPVLNVVLDESANRAGEGVISLPESSCEMRVMAAQEEEQIARHCRRMMRS